MKKVIAIAIWVAVLGVGAVARADTFGTGENQFTIDFVTISGDASSANGTDIGIINGPVYFTDPGYTYRIGTYEITNEQWDKFKASYGIVTGSPSEAYDQDTFFLGYNIPTHNVSWFEAAQFVNWLNISTGHQPAYKFTGTQGTNDYTFAVWDESEAWGGTNLFRHKNAFYFLPTEDEWIKAAYWNGVSFQEYATKAGETLFQGDGESGTGWCYNQDWDSEPWEVGSGSQELNGTYDMMGNINEWMESPDISGDYLTDSQRGKRGGAYNQEAYRLSIALHGNNFPIDETLGIGFRVASVFELPSSPPIADPNGPYTLFVGDTLTLNGSGSTDPDNDIVSYMWDLDDDEIYETNTGTEAVFTLNYAYLESINLLIDHTYIIHLKVTDSEGQSDIAETTLTILPKPAVQIFVDIKPGGCPNPLNTKSSGVLPVAILGTLDLDVTAIDPTSIRLAGVQPLRSSFEDVATPLAVANDCECTDLGPDGFMDLTLKFDTQEIVEAIGEVNNGDVKELELTGILYDPAPYEVPIEGVGCVVIKGRHKPINIADANKDGYVNILDMTIFAQNWLESSIVE